jgi:hypothetical protein
MSEKLLKAHDATIVALIDEMVALGKPAPSEKQFVCLLQTILVAEVLRRKGCTARVVGGLELRIHGTARSHFWLVDRAGVTCDPGSVARSRVHGVPPGTLLKANHEGFDCPATHVRMDLDTPKERIDDMILAHSYLRYIQHGFKTWYDSWKEDTDYKRAFAELLKRHLD